MGKIQELFQAAAGGVVIVPPGEYEGPLVIDRPCTLDGSGATLWAGSGPVLQIAAKGVSIQNLRVEVTGIQADREAQTAIKTSDPHTRLRDVAVCGCLEGFAGEPGVWNLPSVISLGVFAAERQNTFSISLQVPAAAELECRIDKLSVNPSRLAAGNNTVVLTTGELRDNTILYGELLVQSVVTRRIYVSGKALKNAPCRRKAFQIPEASILSRPVLPMETPAAMSQPPSVTGDPPSTPTSPRGIPAARPHGLPDHPLESIPYLSQTLEKVTTHLEQSVPPEGAAPQPLRRGQRISLKSFDSNLIKLSYTQKYTPTSADVDCFCFLLKENGRVRRDEDMIFFGNTAAPDGSVRLETSTVIVDLEKIPVTIGKIVICYSVYGNDPSQNFSQVFEPALRIYNGRREIYRFDLCNLARMKTIVAAEIYRYKGEWKLNCVGAGYQHGIRRLCRDYGVNVE